jgi:hypothetical protein
MSNGQSAVPARRLSGREGDATDKPDNADDQDKQAQRPFQSVGRKCVEHQDKPDRYKT